MTEAELQTKYGATIDVPDAAGLRALREAGEIWRLRDELCRAVGIIYNRENLENCGRVLLEMGDGRAAGLYLFWSGARDEQYGQALDSFLEGPRTYTNTNPRKAFALTMDVTLPSESRELPKSVLQELQDQEVTWEYLTIDARTTRKEQIANLSFFVGCILTIIGSAVCLGVGAYAIWQFLLGN